MSRRNADPWGEYRRDRDDISTAAAFFMTFALLALVAWVIFFGTGWLVPAATDALPLKQVRTPAAYTSASISSPGISFPITNTAAVTTTDTSTNAQPTATPSPKPVTTKLRVANTGGDGVYLRRSPSESDLWIPWPDTTIVDYLDEERNSDGRAYKKVRDPRGNVGWIPSEYLALAQ